VKVSGHKGEEKVFFAFTKVVRLKRYGRKRLVIVHEQPDLSDAPRFLVTDALHWESGRVIQTWSYALASEVFSEVCSWKSPPLIAWVREGNHKTAGLGYLLSQLLGGKMVVGYG
jgi:hypothetical protein